MTATIIWLIIGLVLCTIEIITPTFLLLPVGIASFVVAVFSIFKVSILVQIIILAVVSAALYIFVTPKLLKKSDETFNYNSLVGQKALVTSDICKGKGSVKVEGTIWSAKCDTPVDKGEYVVIKKVEGVTLIVEKEKQEA